MPDNSAAVFAALSDATRRSIVRLMLDRLAAGELTTSASDVVEAAGVARQSANRHLGILAETGIAVPRDEGSSRAYTLDPEPLADVADWLAPFVALEHGRADGTASETVYAAWSGADVGETIGRTVAERTHQARVAIEQTRSRVVDRLPGPIARRVGRSEPRDGS